MCAVAVATGKGNFQSGNHGSSNQIRGAPHCGSKVLFGSEYLTDLLWHCHSSKKPFSYMKFSPCDDFRIIYIGIELE